MIERYPRCRAARHALDPRRRARPDHAGDPGEPRGVRLAGAARQGIEIRTGTRLERWTSAAPCSRPARRVPTRTVVLDGRGEAAAGRQRSSVSRSRGAAASKPTRCMRVKGQRQRLGDRRFGRRPRSRPEAQGAEPPTAQHAIRQGRVVGSNVAAALAGKKPRPFRYRTLGVFVDLGQHKAVADDARHPPARLPGLVRRPHLPPGDDARHGTPGAPGGRLDRRPVVRPRVRRARSAGAPAVPGTYLDEARQQDEAPGQ